MLNYIDIIIGLIIVFSAIAGFKKGFFSELVSLIGFVAIVVIAFIFKEQLANVFFTYLPFFKFGGPFQDVTVLNILMYEILAFIVIFVILGTILKIILMATNIFETILKFTVIFGLPSKIAGAIVGAAEGYLIAFIILMFVNQPTFLLKDVDESSFGNKILIETPYISEKTKGIVDSTTELYALKTKFEKSTNADDFNREALDVLLKNKIVKVESIDILINNKKINIPNIENVLGGYR